MTFACGNRAKAWLHGAVALVGLAGAGAGCTSADKELSLEQARRQAEWKALVAPGHEPTAVTLDWNTALERLRKHNNKVLSADLDISRAAEALDQVKRSLIPTANFSAAYQHFFSSSGNAGFEPFTFAASLFFDVPGFFTFKVRYEAAVLTLAHARLVRETIWRQQVIALYRAALEGRDLDARADLLSRRQSAVASLAADAPDTAAVKRGELSQERSDLSRIRDDWLVHTGEILGMPGVPLVISDAGLPPLPYAVAADRPRPEQLAQLTVRMAALDLLALRARRLGITIQEWPEIEMSVSSPTVYEAGNGSTYSWSPRQVFLSVGAYWTLDTQGKHASDRRLLAEETVVRREVLEQEAAAAAAKLREALDGLAKTDGRIESVDKALASSDAALRPALSEARESLLADRRDWSLTLWFFDDSLWNNGGQSGS
jgi:hypothetical protein